MLHLERTRIGPYRLMDSLGEGGMGTVYRARHFETGEVVALKTVRMARPGLLEGLRREIWALARIRHPGIVAILDSGVHEGMPWYAMELLEGALLSQFMKKMPGLGSAGPVLSDSASRSTDPLEVASETVGSFTPSASVTMASANPSAEEDGVEGKHHISRRRQAKEATTRPDLTQTLTSMMEEKEARSWNSGSPRHRPHLPCSWQRSPAAAGRLAQVLGIVYRLCEPLAYLHGEGLVHRDLKANNILVKENGCPVLMDFGLMSRFGGQISREVLERTGPVFGTIYAMAPELIRGQLVDARADLYSLGCILYELVAGLRPFEGKTPGEVLVRHLKTRPVPPSDLVSGIPAGLDELILKLLEKDPRNRIGYAEDIASALRPLLQELECLPPPASYQAPRPKSYLYRAGFEGRQEEFSMLRKRLGELVGGKGSAVLLGGEAGIGKTRLAKEVAREAQLRNLTVFVTEADPAPLQRDKPLHPLRTLLCAVADRCREKGVEETDHLLGDRGRILAQYEPSFADLPGQERYPEPAALSLSGARLRLFSCLTQTLRALCSHRPVVLLIDDLQWADGLTLGFLRHLLDGHQLQEMPLFLVGAYRSDEVGKELSALLQSNGYRDIHLGQLKGEAVGAMIGNMLALGRIPPGFVQFLRRQSEGNPLFVGEYLKTAVSQGLLLRDAKGLWQIAEPGSATDTDYGSLPIPKALRSLILRRLDELSQDARHLLEVAALLGHDAETDLLAEVTGLGRARLTRATFDLMDRKLLEPVGEEAVRFVHDKFRELAYEGISKPHRRELHRMTAAVLEELHHDGRTVSLAALAHHWERAGRGSRARIYYLPAAREALKRHASFEAEKLFEAYLRLTPKPTAESIEARNDLAHEVLQLQGRTEEAISMHRSALEEAKQLHLRPAETRSLLELGIVHDRIGRVYLAEAFFRETLEIVRTLGDKQMEAIVLTKLAAIQLGLGEVESSKNLLCRAVELNRKLGEKGGEAAALVHLADLHLQQNRLEEAGKHYHRALGIHRENHNRRGEGYTLLNLAILRRSQGDLPAAEERFTQALGIFSEIGCRRGTGYTSLCLGILHRDRGHRKLSHKFYRTATEIFSETGDVRGKGYVLVNASTLLRDHASYRQGLELSEQAAELFRQLGEKRGLAHALLAVQENLLAAGQMDQAAELSRESLAIFEAISDERGQAAAERALGSTKLFLGKLQEAQRLLERSVNRFTTTQDPFELVETHCVAGRIALARGLSPDWHLEEADRLAKSLDISATSQIVRSVQRLARAKALLDAGQGDKLFYGLPYEETPPLLRQTLEQTDFAVQSA